jgi:hypothetical protein
VVDELSWSFEWERETKAGNEETNQKKRCWGRVSNKATQGLHLSLSYSSSHQNDVIANGFVCSVQAVQCPRFPVNKEKKTPLLKRLRLIDASH